MQKVVKQRGQLYVWKHVSQCSYVCIDHGPYFALHLSSGSTVSLFMHIERKLCMCAVKLAGVRCTGTARGSRRVESAPRRPCNLALSVVLQLSIFYILAYLNLFTVLYQSSPLAFVIFERQSPQYHQANVCRRVHEYLVPPRLFANCSSAAALTILLLSILSMWPSEHNLLFRIMRFKL